MEESDCSRFYSKCRDILREELIPAMGCTEPIAIALCAAKARDVLGMPPEAVEVEASGSIIKNVKSVIVPHTDHMKGIDTAAAVGIIGGKTEKMLNVLADVAPKEQELIRAFLTSIPIKTSYAKGGRVFDIIVTVKAGEHYAKVRIADYHTNIVHIEKDGEIILDKSTDTSDSDAITDRSILSVEGIWDFAMNSDIDKMKPILDPQIKYNMLISEEGLKNDYGANIGKTILAIYGDKEIKVRARAAAAAGSDARMNGCEMPVIINSGSGNQGMTVSIPVITYARELNVGEDRMYRALALSNLIAIHQKTGIGTLSAYCGAMSAGIGAGCGIAYLLGGNLDAIKHTLINALVTVSGIICDGAKASCASKIATAVEAGINGYYMYLGGNNFNPGDGIVGKDVEETIRNVGRLAREGMSDTNDTIINIMIQK
ncbi:MAG: L-serine ammonia-lyase, iron-sulfur-dependent, subunit alpha [Lachnospiraceae bacterium]|nr:L-serine ammonia-lyase, iron-sulfur-dependent, subunit alpha [Lachnospiraceae bacterium]